MYKVLVLVSGAAAFVHQQPGAPATALASKADLVEFAEANPTPASGFWDPLTLADQKFWNKDNEATIGWLRHAEIKHGRVAMAAFVGFCVQSNFHVPWTPYPGFVEADPWTQWINLPFYAKLQIFTFIGMLESYGEGAAMDDFQHYMKGGKPGYYPPIKGKGLAQILLNLVDPFGLGLSKATEAQKEKGLLIELNNGRLAQIGIFSLLSEAAVPGAVPGLRDFAPDFPTFPEGVNVMAPFSGPQDFF